MTPSSKASSCIDQIGTAFIATIDSTITAAKSAGQTWQSAVDNFTSATNSVAETITSTVLPFMEQGTETVGEFVTPIAEHPLTKYAAKVPGIGWLLIALGQVDLEQVQHDIEQLHQKYPLETSAQLAQRIMVDTSFKAGSIGLLTNFIPPLALALFAVDIAAITTLQAEMVYRIAAGYGFSLQDPARRGEVLAIFGLSVAGAGPLKAGLSIVELIPLVGAVVGATSNATILYSLGYTACRYYEAKRNFLS